MPDVVTKSLSSKMVSHFYLTTCARSFCWEKVNSTCERSLKGKRQASGYRVLQLVRVTVFGLLWMMATNENYSYWKERRLNPNPKAGILLLLAIVSSIS